MQIDTTPLRRFLAGNVSEFVEIAAEDLQKLVDVADGRSPSPRAPRAPEMAAAA